jgi:biotin operon repressor
MNYGHIYQSVRKYKLAGIWWDKPRCFSQAWMNAWDGTWAGTPSESNRTRYEYKLCHHMALREFNDREMVSILYAWWNRHGLEAHYQSLVTAIIPSVRRFTAEAVAAARTARNRAKRLRRHQHRLHGPASTRERIIARLWETAFTSILDLAGSVGITHAAAKKQVQRLTKEGLLLKTDAGYEVAK